MSVIKADEFCDSSKKWEENIVSQIGYALRIAKEYYTKEGYDHALRVAGYVAENLMIPADKMDTCIALAIMHDLLEDSSYDYSGEGKLTIYFINCLDFLTKKKDESYTEYIDKIRKNSKEYPEAYWVKLADMKDHLTQKETLTDKLRDKYLAALPELL